MINKIKALIYSLSQGNPKVFGIIFIAAFFVTLARLLAPVEMNWDEAVQLEAAHRLVKGLGLTSTFFPPPFDPEQIPTNINQAAIPQYLTWWPPGFSLIVASLLFLGLPLATSLKIIYGTVTIIGWFGWAILGSYCLSKPIKIGKIFFPAQFFVAAILPIFYTPAWQGTDIFLWFITPFLVLLVFNSLTKQPLKYVAIAGLLFGVSVWIRYSSLFLAIAAFFILLPGNFDQIKGFVKRYSIFLLSLLLLILPLSIYNKFAGSNKPAISLYNNSVNSSSIPGLPEFVNLKGGFSNLFESIGSIIKSSTTISTLSGLPQDTLLKQLESYPIVNYAYGAFCLILILSLPLLTITRNKQRFIEEKNKDIITTIAIVPTSLILLLVVSNFAQDYDFVGTGRYYIPVFLPTIFVAYALATSEMRSAYRLIKLALAIFIISFVSYNLIYRPVFMPGRKFHLPQSVLGSYLMYRHDYQYPSNQVITLYDETSSAVRQLQKDNPQALFFVQDYPFYAYDGHQGLRTIPVGNSNFWKQAYVEKAVKVFWVVARSCPGICQDHSSQPIPRLSSQIGLKTVYTSKREKTKILVSNLPSGYKFLK